MTLVLLAAAWITGIYLADRFGASAPALSLFLVAWLLLVATLTPLRRFTGPAILVAVILLAMLRVELFGDQRASELAAYHGRGTLQLQGVVTRDPEAAGSAARVRLRVDRVKPGDVWTDTSGDLVVTLRETTELVQQRDRPYFRYGDRLLLEGAVEPPPTLEGLDYPAYLARQGVDTVMSFPEATLLGEGEGAAFYRWLYGVRRRMADSLAQVVPEPQASLGQALLLGIRDNLPEDLVDEFRDTGTTHLLAISGLHLSILLGIGLAVGQWVLGRRRQLYLVLPFALIWLYALISGMSPSVTRAAIMGSVYLAAVLLGRPRNVFPALGLAAALMVAINPNVLWNISFQLSFTAMAGIAVLVEPINRILGRVYSRIHIPDEPRPPILAVVTDTIAMTIAATVATLPLVAFYFDRVSLVGIPTNAVLLPALPFVLVTQAAVGLLEPVADMIAQPFGWLAWLTSAYVTGVVGLVARLPGASVETGQAGSAVLWTAYGLFILVLLRFRPGRLVRPLGGAMPGHPLSLSAGHGGVPWWVTAFVAALAALLWIAALSAHDSRLHVAFVDVGQGDTIFITTPSGRQILVDGGPAPMGAVHYLGRVMPFRDRTIDLVVLTHPQKDHVNGLLEVLRRYDVERVLEREMEFDGPSYQAWRRAVVEERAAVIRAQAGQLIVMGDGVFMQVVNPPDRPLRGTSSDIDNASVALRLVYGEVSFMLSGDMFREAEAALVRDGAHLDSDVLKVGHHGSHTSSSAVFLDSVSPAVAVISVGEDNRYGHPHPKTLEALRRWVPEERLFLTSDRGTVEFVTDGERLRVKTER